MIHDDKGPFHVVEAVAGSIEFDAENFLKQGNGEYEPRGDDTINYSSVEPGLKRVKIPKERTTLTQM